MQNLALLLLLDWLLDGKGSRLFDTRWQILKAEKRGNRTSKTRRFFFGGSGHGPESSCQISACYKFFSDKSYF